MIICCAGPLLIAAGALGALSGALGNPWLITTAIAIAAAAITLLVHRHRAGRTACCPPTSSSHGPGEREQPHAPGNMEGRHHP